MERRSAGLDGQHFDLLVCGGGIYGAWTAYDAALRGLNVIILEKGDWASATSSGSSKLIHGGLRYLQTMQFALVRKSLREREMFFKVAPHRVQPLRFGIPSYPANPVGRLQLGAGLWLYDMLAGIQTASTRHGRYSKDNFCKRYPCLTANDLHGGFDYVDGQTDDARFVLEIIDGALSHGATGLNYCEVTKLKKDSHNHYCGAEINDRILDKHHTISASATVCASGQWTEQLIKSSKNYYRLSKGIHLILPNIGLQHALLLFARSDGRVFFIIPWYGVTLLGTTDDDYRGDIDKVQITKSEIKYLLNAANDYLTPSRWRETDILGQYAGVRVLKNNAGSSSYRLSRDWELLEPIDGLLLSVGGKFSSARQDAATIVDRVCERLSITPPCQTDRAFPWTPESKFEQWKSWIRSLGVNLRIDSEALKILIFRHGKGVEAVFSLIENEKPLSERIFPELPFIYADLLHCAKLEMVIHLEDLIRRRMPLLLCHPMSKPDLHRIADKVASTLNWDQSRIEREVSLVAEQWKIP